MKFQAARGKERSDDEGSDDVISKAPEHKQKSDARPVESCRRSLARGKLWDSFANLLRIMKLPDSDVSSQCEWKL